MSRPSVHSCARQRLGDRSGLPLALLLGLAALMGTVGPAGASERPRIVVSPDLNAPWVLTAPGAPRIVRPPRRAEPRSPRSRRALARVPRGTPSPTIRRAGVPTPNASVSRGGGQIPRRFLPQVVRYERPHAPGTIYIDTVERYLYLVLPGGMARRYGVGVGKPGFEWAGTHRVTRKAEWPSWRPPREMIERERLKGRELPAFMEGGPANPLGARALYLGSTLYRIHGTNQPWTIGLAVSSGCIRMRNIDVVDLYERVPHGAKVIVR